MGVSPLLQHAVSLRWAAGPGAKHLRVGRGGPLWFAALAVPLRGSSEGAGSALPGGCGVSCPKWCLPPGCLQDVFLSSASFSPLDFSKCHRLWLTGDKRSACFKGHRARLGTGVLPSRAWEAAGGNRAHPPDRLQMACGQPQLHKQ